MFPPSLHDWAEPVRWPSYSRRTGGELAPDDRLPSQVNVAELHMQFGVVAWCRAVVQRKTPVAHRSMYGFTKCCFTVGAAGFVMLRVTPSVTQAAAAVWVGMNTAMSWQPL